MRTDPKNVFLRCTCKKAPSVLNFALSNNPICKKVHVYTVHTLTPSKKDQKDILQTLIENMVIKGMKYLDAVNSSCINISKTDIVNNTFKVFS